MKFDRRTILKTGVLSIASLWREPSLHAQVGRPDILPPILFAHGNGDHAALWQTAVWRFESNDYPRDRLVAFNFSNPLARDDDSRPQENRSSTDDQLRELSMQIDEVLKRTRARQVALIGSSRGGNAIRNYLSQTGRPNNVSHVVLCGTPNHGVYASDTRLGNEFNGSGPFLSRLNAQPDEVSPGPSYLTLRSDNLDKFAQPDGRLIGRPGTPTNVTFDSPELKGAKNLALGAIDHRETAFHPRAFREMYKFIAGGEPSRIAVVPEQVVSLSGLVTGLPGGIPTNRPVDGALIEVFATSAHDGSRMGEALYRGTTGPSGAWGPVTSPANASLEFVITANGYPVTHIYRTPFPRSSTIIHLRPGRPLTAEESNSGAVILFSRARGYFGLPRDVVVLDGREPGDIKMGVPADAISTLKLEDFSDRSVIAEFNEERIVCRPWPARNNHLTIAELTY